jgi:tRNA(Ile)-lysidine synthetase-like protein
VPHSSIDLPAGIVATIEQGRLHIIEKKDMPHPPESFCVKLENGKSEIPEINAEIIIGNSQTPKNIYKNSTLLYLDSDKICGALTARERRAGDKIRHRGMNKSIKKLLCDKKIPLSVRYRLPMICDGETVIAIPFVAVADGYASSESKDGALCVRFDLFE